MTKQQDYMESDLARSLIGRKSRGNMTFFRQITHALRDFPIGVHSWAFTRATRGAITVITAICVQIKFREKFCQLIKYVIRMTVQYPRIMCVCACVQ